MRFKKLILISAAAFATAVVVRKLLATNRTAPAINTPTNHHEYDVDAKDDDSSPASDPPSWSGGHYH